MSVLAASVCDSLASNRYRVTVLINPQEGVRILLIDTSRGRLLFDWRGAVAHRLLNSGLIACDVVAGEASVHCDKRQMCHLALHAAALRSLLSSMGIVESLVAQTVFAHPGEHLCCTDVQTLLAMKQQALAIDAVQRGLNSLVSRSLLQEIRISDRHVFYDIDTRPHAHVFDAETGLLHDAHR